jgi:hypothetical protein
MSRLHHRAHSNSSLLLFHHPCQYTTNSTTRRATYSTTAVKYLCIHHRESGLATTTILEVPLRKPRSEPAGIMSQNYGATSPPVTPASRRRMPTDQVYTTPAKSISSLEPQGTVWSSIVNLTNTTVGAGALAFPSAFSAMGLVPGVASCLVSASTAAFGLYLLSRCATQVGQRPGDEGRKASFNEVARISFGKGWITRLFDVSSCNLWRT